MVDVLDGLQSGLTPTNVEYTPRPACKWKGVFVCRTTPAASHQCMGGVVGAVDGADSA